MQDYVKTVPPSQKVAWTRYPQWLGYFPCKNDIISAAKLSASGVPPHSASSSEMAVYHFRILGCTQINARPASVPCLAGMACPTPLAVRQDPLRVT